MGLSRHDQNAKQNEMVKKPKVETADTLIKIAALDQINSLEVSEEESQNNLYYITLSEDGVVEMVTEYEN